MIELNLHSSLDTGYLQVVWPPINQDLSILNALGTTVCDGMQYVMLFGIAQEVQMN